MIWVTHDLGVIARLVERVVVMYTGRVVECAPTRGLFAHPNHPYTLALLGSLPQIGAGHRQPLTQIGGNPPDSTRLRSVCPFVARCPFAFERCTEEEPPLIPRGDDSYAACWKAPEQWAK